MCLRIFKDVKKVGEFEVVVMDELREKYPEKFNESGSMDYKWFEEHIRPKNFVYVRNDKNSLSFTIQDGPVSEKGVNGCQVDTLIESAKIILESFNKELSCRENSIAITKLDEALLWLKKRTEDRKQRGVEGTNNA